MVRIVVQPARGRERSEETGSSLRPAQQAMVIGAHGPRELRLGTQGARALPALAAPQPGDNPVSMDLDEIALRNSGAGPGPQGSVGVQPIMPRGPLIIPPSPLPLNHPASRAGELKTCAGCAERKVECAHRNIEVLERKYQTSLWSGRGLGIGTMYTSSEAEGSKKPNRLYGSIEGRAHSASTPPSTDTTPDPPLLTLWTPAREPGDRVCCVGLSAFGPSGAWECQWGTEWEFTALVGTPSCSFMAATLSELAAHYRAEHQPFREPLCCFAFKCAACGLVHIGDGGRCSLCRRASVSLELVYYGLVGDAPGQAPAPFAAGAEVGYKYDMASQCSAMAVLPMPDENFDSGAAAGRFGAVASPSAQQLGGETPTAGSQFGNGVSFTGHFDNDCSSTEQFDSGNSFSEQFSGDMSFTQQFSNGGLATGQFTSDTLTTAQFGSNTSFPVTSSASCDQQPQWLGPNLGEDGLLPFFSEPPFLMLDFSPDMQLDVPLDTPMGTALDITLDFALNPILPAA